MELILELLINSFFTLNCFINCATNLIKGWKLLVLSATLTCSQIKKKALIYVGDCIFKNVHESFNFVVSCVTYFCDPERQRSLCATYLLGFVNF